MSPKDFHASFQKHAEHDASTRTPHDPDLRDHKALEDAPRFPDAAALVPIVPQRNHRPWPAPLEAPARIGLVGDLIEAIEPTTEGDPNAILIQFLSAFGSLLGSAPHLVIDEKRHPLKIWALVVGSTAYGKKGTGLHRVVSLLDAVDPTWTSCRRNGIASGEAIVHQVRDDEVRTKRTVKADGTVVETSETVAGVDDKRLLLKEEEFSRVLRVSRKPGSTVSAVLREAWDSEVLMSTSKTQPEKATGAHVVVIGHITPEELQRDLSSFEVSNGFANRFLFVASRRSKRLARPPRMTAKERRQLVLRLRLAVETARERVERENEITLSSEAWRLWEGVKTQVEDSVERIEAGGLVLAKAITRGPPYVLRLAALYAVLDAQWQVTPRHLEAAREVWRYAVDSARYVLGDGLSDGPTRRVLEALAESPANRLTRTDLREAYGRHKRAEDIDALRDRLIASGKIKAFRESESRRGRPREWWVLG